MVSCVSPLILGQSSLGGDVEKLEHPAEAPRSHLAGSSGCGILAFSFAGSDSAVVWLLFLALLEQLF